MKHTVAILGLSHWYSAYPIASAICLRPDLKLKWIIDECEQKASQAAKLFSAQCSTDKFDALNDPEVSIVIITGTTDQHEPLAVEAARAGKHILLGKPVARTLSGAKRILQAVNQYGVKLMGLGAGADPSDILIRLTGEGVIGTPYAVTTAWRARLPLQAPGDVNPGWFIDPNRASGGAFIDHAIYEVTRMSAIFKSPVKSIYARMRKMALHDIDVEDYGIAMVEYESGAIAVIESTFGATEYTQNQLTLTGTDGEISMSGDELKIVDRKSTQITKLIAPNPVFQTVDEILHNPFGIAKGDFYSYAVPELIDVIENNAFTYNTIENGIKGLEVCLAAYKSLKTGLPVKLPLDEEVDVPSILKKLDTFQSKKT